MKRIKVVHMITKLELGGAQINTIHTYENLNDTQFDTYLLSGPGGILTETIRKKKNLIIINDLIREINPPKDIKALLQTKKILKKIKPDIVHTHSSKAGIIGRTLKIFLKNPIFIHSVHGFPFSPFQTFFKKKIYSLIEKWISKITDHFIFVSNSDIKCAKQKKLIKQNYSLIRSGFELNKFQKTNHNQHLIRKKYNINVDDFVCGIIAPFKSQKGLFHLIEIASLVIRREKKTIFFIAGDGELRKDIESELRQRKISNHFRLPGFIFDIQEVIDIFDLGVSTALWEGLPQSLIQLRLKKKAVVASDIPGNREVIKDNKNGFLVNVFDYKTFSDKILYLMETKKERARLSNHSENLSDWDADHMVETQEILYQSLIRSKIK